MKKRLFLAEGGALVLILQALIAHIKNNKDFYIKLLVIFIVCLIGYFLITPYERDIKKSLWDFSATLKESVKDDKLKPYIQYNDDETLYETVFEGEHD